MGLRASFSSAYATLGERVVATLIFLLPIFSLTVKGWASGFFILLSLLCLFLIFKNRNYYFSDRESVFWVFLLVIITPFIAEILCQIGRWQVHLKAIDGPSRFLLAGVIFVYISKGPAKSFFERFAVGLTVCVGVTIAISLWGYTFYPEIFFDKWNRRLSQYFGDPNTFGVFFAAFLGIIGMMQIRRDDKNFPWLFLAIIIFFLGVYVVILTGSRSAYLTLISFYILFFTCKFFRNPLKLFGALFLVGLTSLIFMLSSEMLRSRIMAVNQDISSYHVGDTYTSTGTRHDLFVYETQLIRQNPFFGAPEENPPALIKINGWSPERLAYIHRQWELAGSHSGVFVHLSSKGVFLGVLTVFALYIYPLWVCLQRIRRGVTEELNRLSIFISFFGALLASSFFIQIINLKMYAAIYALFSAIIFAYLLQEKTTLNRGAS